MFVNKYKININTLSSGTTATTINIPITMDFQMVDQSEIVEREFVDIETEKAINPIVDYEYTRFIPLDLKNNSQDVPINKIVYELNFDGGTTYGDLGFTDDDIKFQKSVFTKSFLNLNFYDNDNPLTQRLVTNMTLYARITSNDLVPFGSTIGIVGQPKPANQIPLILTLESPLLNKKGDAEGYYLYDYKDELAVGEFKYLYMRASFKNAKDGTSTNLMVQPNALAIDKLVHELYTRFKLIRKPDGYYYEVDELYHGNTSTSPTNNVTYTTNGQYNDVKIKLYKILAL